jgi:primase-polymerase (primpol)-like protein
MAKVMNPEQNSYEQFEQDPTQLRDRFRFGLLKELQDLNQWVVWRAEIEDSKPKKVPYNPNFDHLQERASVKIPKSCGTLADALLTLESGHYSGLGFVITPSLVKIDLDHSVDKATGTIIDPQAA